MSDTLRDLLDNIKPRVALKGDPNGCHRPQLRLWADYNDELGGGAAVIIMVDAMMGEQKRYIEITPNEARHFSLILHGLLVEIESATKIANKEAAP
jgi:hypothetical protein